MKYLVAICFFTLIISCQERGLGAEAIFSTSNVRCTSIEGENEPLEVSLLMLSDGTWIGWQGRSMAELLFSKDEGTPAASGTWIMAQGKYALKLDKMPTKENFGFLLAWDGAEAFWTDQGWRIVDSERKEFCFWDPQDYLSKD